MSVILFFIGLWVGGTVGVFTMCLFQINKGTEEKLPLEKTSHFCAKGDLE